MIKRLIFDVDGTLIVGVNFIESVKNALSKYNLNNDENLNKFLDGIKTYEKEYNSYNKTDYLKHFNNYFNNHLDDKFIDIFFNELKNCVPENNAKLQKSISDLAEKYELVILTNYFSESQLNRLNTMKIGKFFSKVYGEDLIKPNKDAYINACGGLQSRECIMIGDDKVLDIEGAAKYGLNTILVNSKKYSNLDNIISVNSVEEITEKFIYDNFEK